VEQTIAAQEMIQALAEITSVEDLATTIGMAERLARANGMTRVATVHIRTAMERMGDPMAPDYDALAAEKPTSQNKDSRDAAEVAG